MAARFLLAAALVGAAVAYTPSKAGVPARPQHCDMVASGSLCLANGEKVILPDAVPKGMLGRWTFDDNKALDSSGKRNHAKNAIPAGPGVGSRGSSARFNGYDLVEIPHHESLNSQTFTMSFWMYLVKDPQYNTRWRSSDKDWVTIVQKGKNEVQRAPAVYLEPRIRQLKVAVSTKPAASAESDAASVYVMSNSRIQFERWTHVALVRKSKSVQLFVNGILDGQNVTESDATTEMNSGALYVGNTPWQVDSGTFPMYVDELKLYGRAVSADEIEAEASPALGGVEPSFVRLGCTSCTYDDAAQSCPEDYHMCSAMELHIGGYQIARTMGWGEWSSHIWSKGIRDAETSKPDAALKKEMERKGLPSTGEVGLALCCINAK